MAELLDRPATLGPFDKSKKGTASGAHHSYSIASERAAREPPLRAVLISLVIVSRS